MKIVLDSNVLLVSLGKRSRFRPIWDAFVEGAYQLIISEEIVNEYEEILQEHSAPGVAGLVMNLLEESPDVSYQRISYNWRAVPSDPDDDKFFDTAVAGNADYLVTDDSHFKEAMNLEFPKVSIISSEKFQSLLSNLHSPGFNPPAAV